MFAAHSCMICSTLNGWYKPVTCPALTRPQTLPQAPSGADHAYWIFIFSCEETAFENHQMFYHNQKLRSKIPTKFSIIMVVN